jgi:SSS family solute:Na+ symporter
VNGLSAVLLFSSGPRLMSLSSVDLLIIILYFVAVLGLGVYLKRFAHTGEEFFMAGRQMTAWIAGLSFISANLGSLEMMGYAAATYQYGILVAHAYWIAAIPAILFLALVMLPFYYICRTHSVPGYLKLRYGEGARSLSAISFAVMTVLMSGINMYSMAVIMKVILGWNIHFSIWVSSLTVAIYVMAGGLLSAIFNEVLQFFLIWFGALLIPILGLIEAGGWKGMVAW